MPLTLGNVVATVRGILQDQRAPYRYPDAELAGYVSEALLEARRVRPDIYIEDPLGEVPAYTQQDVVDNVVVELPAKYGTPLANYTAGRANLRDDAFSADSRAALLMTSFLSALGVGRGAGPR